MTSVGRLTHSVGFYVGRQCNPARKIPDHHGDRTRDLPVLNQADTLPRRYKS
ncbi:hypothetical protein DPMN_136005 [Dreissena polymorpha]|uniref:Uncharacterized protein n=1 Tax=Dreissena polymorpha TaxID=45954 RepID=A0A9D4G2U7_DREPO|nr:hypothetical protein DPMN_136005 [Dreissena polymorpha]